MNNENVRRHCKIFDKLKADRANLDNVCHEVAHYVIPRKDNFNTKKGNERYKTPGDVYDSTAAFALNVFAAGMHGYFTSPATKWFRLTTSDKRLYNSHSVKVWLEEAEDTMYSIINGTNFYQMIYEQYIDLGAFGTSTLFVEDDVEDIVRYYSHPLYETYILEDSTQRPRTLYRYFEMTTEQISLRFKKVPDEINLAMKRGDILDKHWVIHVITPRFERDSSKIDVFNKKYASVYILREKESLLEESGFSEIPFHVTRFLKDSSSPYGFSPAMLALPHVKTLNKGTFTLLRTAEKIADPPVEVDSNSYILPLDFNASAVNYRRSGDGKIEQIVPRGNLPVTAEVLDGIRNQVLQMFYVDMFLSLMGHKNMTATEVQERVTEKMLIIGPALGRLQKELLNPIVRGLFRTAQKKKLIPPAPAWMKGKTYDIEYVSPLARAQKASELGSIRQLNSAVAEMISISPEVFGPVVDNFDMDKEFRKMADIIGVPPSITRSENEVLEIRRDRAMEQEEMMKMQMLAQGGGVASDYSKAELNSSKAKEAQ